MSVEQGKAYKYKVPRKQDIRCKDIKTLRGFKRMAADFKNYEETLAWFVKITRCLKKSFLLIRSRAGYYDRVPGSAA